MEGRKAACCSVLCLHCVSLRNFCPSLVPTKLHSSVQVKKPAPDNTWASIKLPEELFSGTIGGRGGASAMMDVVS